jgi:uncharacterized protein
VPVRLIWRDGETGLIGLIGTIGEIGITGVIGRTGEIFELRAIKFPSSRYNGPIAESVQLLVIQPTPFCNILCDYCYLPNRNSTARLEKETFKRILQNVFESGLVSETLSIVWHAGEPLALPVPYYSSLFAAISELGIAPQQIRHSMQTNGTLINSAWCDFIVEHQINIGVSIDGPEFIHDQHRKDRQGKGTHGRVLKGVRHLQERNIAFHVIAVVTADSLNYAEAIFDFFLDLGVQRLGFNVEEVEGEHPSSSLKDSRLEDRIRNFWLDLYHKQECSNGRLRIREFDRACERIICGPDKLTVKASMQQNSQVSPLAIISVDYQGNLSSFSPELLGLKSLHYGDFTFGNIYSGGIADVRKNPRFQKVAEDIRNGVKLCETSCEYFKLCGGGAPSNKYFENRSFVSTETMYCRTSIQMPIDVVLSDLEKRLKLADVKGAAI